MTLAKLYILCGLPFAGKSTLARGLAKTHGLVYVAMDTINTERGLGLNGESISEEDWDITYQEAYRRIDSFLAQGKSVIYDAPSFTKEQRDQLRAIAHRYGLPTKVIFVDVPESVVRERWLQNKRTENRFDVRDDDFALVVDNFQPPTDEEDVIRYDQSLPLDEWIHKVFKK
ncbi:MAG TPA: ATP-binding protein [Ktedonobacteraceae bacterium]